MTLFDFKRRHCSLHKVLNEDTVFISPTGDAKRAITVWSEPSMLVSPLEKQSLAKIYLFKKQLQYHFTQLL